MDLKKRGRVEPLLKKMVWADCHCHSQYSADGENTIDTLCKKAVQKRFSVCAVTDHCEINAYETGDYRKLIQKSCREVRKKKEQYADKLELLTGVELGQPMHDLECTKNLLASASFDFVLGSLHNVRGQPDFYFLKYESVDIYALLKQYFDELCEMIAWGGFDSLAHMTYPLRYIVGDRGIPVEMRKLWPWIEEALKLLVEKGLALEINTSGLRQKIGVTLPDVSILKKFHELGGELVTIGSDAHRAIDFGKGIREGYELARSAGFHKLVYFRERKPQEIPIGLAPEA